MCLHLFFVVWSAPPVPHWHTQCSATSEKGKKIKRSLCRNIVELDMDLLFMFGFSGWGKKYNSLIRSREIGTPTQQESQHGEGLAKQVHWKNKKKVGPNRAKLLASDKVFKLTTCYFLDCLTAHPLFCQMKTYWLLHFTVLSSSLSSFK